MALALPSNPSRWEPTLAWSSSGFVFDPVEVHVMSCRVILLKGMSQDYGAQVLLLLIGLF